MTNVGDNIAVKFSICMQETLTERCFCQKNTQKLREHHAKIIRLYVRYIKLFYSENVAYLMLRLFTNKIYYNYCF